MSATIIQFIPRARSNPALKKAYDDVRRELMDLVPFAKSGGPIVDHSEYPKEPA